MDKKVTVKFWQVLPALVDGVEFVDSLKLALSKKGENLTKEFEGIWYQLDPRSKVEDSPLLGDIVRLQSDALPTKRKRGGKSVKLDLGEDEYLGHHTGFIYDPVTKLIGFEAKFGAAGIQKLVHLIAKLAGHTTCIVSPVLTENQVNQLAGTKNGTLMFKIADPISLQAIDPEMKTMRDNLTYLKEMVDGAYISMSIGVGPRREGLEGNKLLKTIGWLLGERQEDRGKVKSLQVRQPHEAEPILDFLKVQVKESKTLKFVEEPEEDWLKRSEFLLQSLAKAKKHVKQ